MRKVLTFGAVLAVAVLLVSTLAIAISITGNAVDIFGVEEGISEFEDSNNFDSVDAFDVEYEMETEIGSVSSGDEAFKSRKMVEVQGFTNDGTRAALIRGLWLQSRVYLSDDSNIEIFTKGKLKIAGINFDVERANDVDSEEAIFRLVGPRDMSGTLKVKLDKSYNEGKIKTWKGSLVINGGDINYNGDVELQTLEKILKPMANPINPGAGSEYEYSGSFNLDDLDFKLQSVGNSNPKKIDFQIFGEDNVEGKSTWKLTESNDEDTLRTYKGKMLIYEVGDEDDIIEGETAVTIQKDRGSNTWSGRIVLVDKVLDREMIGDIQIVESKNHIGSTTSVSVNDFETEEFERENKARKTDTRVKDRGFFSRIFGDIFG